MSSELAKLPPGGSIIFHVHMEAKSIEASNQLVEHLLAVRETVKTSEPGTLTFRICRFEEKLMLLEEYEDEKALQTHLESAAFKAFMAAAPSLSTGPPDLSYYREEL